VLASIPYFASNREWLYYDENEFRHKLKADAPEEAHQSYTDFYARFENYGTENSDVSKEDYGPFQTERNSPFTIVIPHLTDL
jgi:hypothetical protein